MSKYHLAALEVITKPPKNVGEMISQALSQQKKLNSSMLLAIMQSLRFLTRQALALRGHNDDESNFIISHYCEEVCLIKFTEAASDKCLNFRASQVTLNLLLGCTVFSNQEDTSDLAFDTNVYTQS